MIKGSVPAPACKFYANVSTAQPEHYKTGSDGAAVSPWGHS